MAKRQPNGRPPQAQHADSTKPSQHDKRTRLTRPNDRRARTTRANGAASLTKGSRHGFGVTAQIIVGKFCDHPPLSRMDVLRSLAGGQSDPESLLPDVWAKGHPEHVRPYREQESLARAAKNKSRRARRRKLPRR